jgi:non-canonical (house-cleaning) NTP pyrophosphatase
MKITICGSMSAVDTMNQAERQLTALGYEVEKPDLSEANKGGQHQVNAVKKREFIDQHFRKIDDSDAVLIVNVPKNGVDHYVGGNTLIEIARAYAQGLEVFLLHPVPDVSYADEIRGMDPIILDGAVAKIDEYFASLPLVMMSTTSPIKHRAVSRGLRRAGIRTRVDGVKVASGVNEQPQSIEETYEGAINRHNALAGTVTGKQPAYFATIESGQHALHKNHNTFGCSVIVLEKVGQERKIGIDFDLEFPKSMTDRVPSEYPDLGTLVQTEYGAVTKDPFPYFTNHKLTRTKILENAVYNLAAQLEG